MAVKTRFDPPRRCRINTPKDPDAWGKGFYHGMELQAIGIDTDDLIAVPLPAMPDRPAYLGRFKAEFIEFLEN
jgi:hypothetical protein